MQLRQPLPGGDRQFERSKAFAGAQQDVADAIFLTLRADVLPRFQWLQEAHAAVLQHFDVLLHLDAGSAGRQRCAGKNPCAGAGQQRVRRLPGVNLLRDLQRLSVQIGEIERVTVHGAVRPRRQVECRHQITGQHPPTRIVERQQFAVGQTLLIGHAEQLVESVLDRHQRCLAHPRGPQACTAFRCGTKLHGR
ncbi:hypothetical protein D3C81_1411030 [compost metagenome]